MLLWMSKPRRPSKPTCCKPTLLE